MTGTDAAAPPAIELRGITKRFPGVVANEDVDLVVSRGEIHAVVGENGAGKSTLMKILYGMQQPDEGQILVEGEPTVLRSPKDAIAANIGMVHQHVMLADQLTVLENVILGSEPTTGLRLDLARAHDEVGQLAARYGMEVPLDTLVEQLEVGARQRVEILKVLYRGAQLLILDEPTAVLVPHEVEALFANLRELRAEGKTIIFISHKLDEVLAHADTVTVMRGGRTVATVDPVEVTSRDLAELMVGSELPSPQARMAPAGEEVVIAIRDLGVRDADGRWRLRHVDLDVHRGEVVGVAGVEGNGQGVLVEALLGLTDITEGSITLEGTDLAGRSTRERREAGIGYIPEDRHRRGLLLPDPLWENVLLGHQSGPELSHGPFVDRPAARRRAAEVVQRYDVRTPSIDVAAFALSGGNQQKFIIGREMLAGPRLLIAAHPTRGIDVGAQAAVWQLLREARNDGLAVLLVSADLDELIGLSDTLWVILRGELVAQLDPGTVTPSELGSYMTGARGRASA